MDSILQQAKADADFQTALKFDLEHEGTGYEDVPGDGGGPTRSGITWIDGNAYLKSQGKPALSITAARACRLDYLTPDLVAAIYYTKYYLPFKSARLPKVASEVLFDGYVNTGTEAIREAQGVAGVTTDGVFGRNTQAAVNAYISAHTEKSFCLAVISRRRAFYKGIVTRRPDQAKFLDGWLSRCADLEAVVHKALG